MRLNFFDRTIFSNITTKSTHLPNCKRSLSTFGYCDCFNEFKRVFLEIIYHNCLLALPGGLDKTGSPLIIFPPCNEFANINDTDVEKIFHYLVQRFG